MLNTALRRPRQLWLRLRGRKGSDLTRGLGILAVLLLLSLTLAGCSNTGEASETDDDKKDATATEKKKDGEGDEEKKEEDLPPVEVVNLEHGAIEAVLRFSTNLEAESEVQVFSARRFTVMANLLPRVRHAS